MRRRRLGASDLELSVLGLGCAHLASLRRRASAREIDAVLDRALEAGVTLFDTADVYGQGDSERLLGRRLAGRRDRAVLCTKAGLTLGPLQTAVRIAKPVLRPLLRRADALDRAAAAARRERERQDFTPARLRACLDASLRRLRTDHVDVFLLHDPPPAALADGGLYDLLDGLRRAGKTRWCGVSCRSLAEAEAVVAAARVACVQLPLTAVDLDAARPLLRAAQARGIGVIAREVFARGPLAASGAARDPAAFAASLRAVAEAAGVSATLVGVSSRRHLEANLAALDEPPAASVAADTAAAC